MTTNYHTAISVGAAANAATFNTPLGALDAAITNAQSGVYNVLTYGAKGDGATDDTTAIKAAVAALADNSILYFPPATYRVNNFTFSSLDNVLISGYGATLKKIDDATSVFWDEGAAIITLCACTNMVIEGLVFDGNRINQTSNTGMNFGILILPAAPDGTDSLDNNYGETKPTRHILIRDCEFYRTGAYAAGVDKFGDGVYVFAAEDVSIEHCYFKDMGRWAVAMSDVFNCSVRYCSMDNATSGDYATALGSIDIEQESTDATNGSYSRNVVIEHNKIVGYGTFNIQLIPNAENQAGTNHYVRNVHFEYNEMSAAYYATYGVEAINLVNYDVAYSTTPEMSDIYIRHNKVSCTSVTPYTYGVSLYATDTTVIVKDIHIESNSFSGVTNGVYCTSGSPPAYLRLFVDGNTIAAGYAADAGMGIYSLSLSHTWIEVTNNYITDFGTNGVKLVDNSGALHGKVNGNRVVEGLSSFSGVGIYIGHQIDELIGNSVSQTGGTDYTLSYGPLRMAENSWSTACQSFTADDATPSVVGGNFWKTANANATTVTMFDGGVSGQTIRVIINDAVTTVDFSSTNLKGNAGADWSPGSGDWLEATFDGTNWYCSVHDCTA